jgi:hypothetical protein
MPSERQEFIMTDHLRQPPDDAHEQALRDRLGIPDDAEQIMIFAESSHWDPDWVRTSQEYYHRYVRQNLDFALVELLREPRRIYSLECVFFLRMYWDREPQQRETIRTLFNDRRLRLTNSGVSTADTLLPETEPILRDLLIGQEWLRANGLNQEPRLAYFVDSFGASPALPSLLQASGFDRATITRIDGMFFYGCDYKSQRRFPIPGSSAALLSQEHSVDFVWRGPDGAEVLCHWNVCTYGQGDLLAYRGFSRVYLAPVPLAIPDRSDRNVTRRIHQYADQLAHNSRTPYMFCPIGYDFVAPIPDLVGLLDRYNRRHYPETGLWVVNAGLDDYLDLVDCHRSDLPVLELDPNPFWMGFYTSRPTLREKCHELVDELLLAERLALLPNNAGAEQTISQELEGPWWIAAVANHHDFITGTSPDRVVKGEQIPWIDEATAVTRSVIARLAPANEGPKEYLPADGSVEWHGQDGRVQVHTPHYVVELNEAAGGGIVRAWDPTTHQELLTGVSNDLVCYRDSGGLWRMGHEFRGGVFREVDRASGHPAKIEIHEHDNGLEVTSKIRFKGLPVLRRLWFNPDSPLIHMQVEGRAPNRHTITVQFKTAVSPSRLAMDQPGGVVVRPLQKIYNPTFWLLHHFLHAQDSGGSHGFALGLRRPGAAAWRPDGILETIAIRNATRELAYGFVPIAATPATGHERTVYTFNYAVWFTAGGDWQDNGVDLLAWNLAGNPWETEEAARLREIAASVVTVDRSDVIVAAVKPASRGDGLIVRLLTYTTPGPSLRLTVPGRGIGTASLCDARERDLEPLAVNDGTVQFVMPGTIATVRLLASAGTQSPGK